MTHEAEDRASQVERWLMGLVVACSAFVLVLCSPAGAALLSRCVGLVTPF
jgi:hypothetical protein